jgi:hypothetical protein
MGAGLNFVYTTMHDFLMKGTFNTPGSNRTSEPKEVGK